MPRSKKPARGRSAAAGLVPIPVRRFLLRRTGHSRRRAMRVVVMPMMMQTNAHRSLRLRAQGGKVNAGPHVFVRPLPDTARPVTRGFLDSELATMGNLRLSGTLSGDVTGKVASFLRQPKEADGRDTPMRHLSL